MQIAQETILYIGVIEVPSIFIGEFSESFQHVRGSLLSTCVNILESKNKWSGQPLQLTAKVSQGIFYFIVYEYSIFAYF